MSSIFEQAEKFWEQAEAKMQELEQQQAKALGLLEQQLAQCQEKNRRLEEDKARTDQALTALQERLGAAEAALQGRQGCWGVARPPCWGPEAMMPPLGLDWMAALPLRQMEQGPPNPAAATVAAAAAAMAAGKYPPLPAFPHLAGESVAAAAGATKPAAAAAASSETTAAPPAPLPHGESPPPGLPGHTVPSEDVFLAPPPGLLRPPQPSSGAPKRAEEKEDGLKEEFVPRSPQPTRSLLWREPVSPHLAATPQRARAATPQRALTPREPRTPQQRTPRTSRGSLTPMLTRSPTVPASPFVICEGGGCIFGFMLRLADGVDLGLDLLQKEGGNALHVQAILPGGAIEAWNRQCVGGPAAGKAVMPGDKIVEVNEATERNAMLAECRTKQMLRLTVVRGDPDCDLAVWGGHHGSGGHGRGARKSSAENEATIPKSPAPPGAACSMMVDFRTPPRSPALRAGATEFVPGPRTEAVAAAAAAAAAAQA